MEPLHAVLFPPLSPGMNCFIMIKDKTGVNDTFTFPPVKGKPDSIWMKATFSRLASAAGEDGRWQTAAAGGVRLGKVAPLRSPREQKSINFPYRSTRTTLAVVIMLSLKGSY